MILLLGGGGLAGTALRRELARAGQTFVAPPRCELDIGDRAAVRRAVSALRPRLIINAAAYTDVDAAERDTAAADSVNHHGAAHLAEAAHGAGAWLLHLSTDYVFDGCLKRPYRENDTPNPLNIYGKTKLDGETAVRALCRRSVVVRTAWLFEGVHAGFPRTVRRLAQTRPYLEIVAAQYGSPTRASGLAAALRRIGDALAAQPEQDGGIFHFAGSPHISRAAWARRIVAADGLARLPEIREVADFPAAAVRPADSRLDCGAVAARFGIAADDWQA